QRVPSAVIVTLEATMHTNPGLQPSPVHPMRKLRLTPAPRDQLIDRTTAWSLALMFLRKRRRRPLHLLIDPPWDFDLGAAQAALREGADELEALADAASRGPKPWRVEITERWRVDIKYLRAAADRLGPASPSKRPAILQRCFSLPGTIFLSPVAFITADLPPARLALLLGLELRRAGLLSVREGRQFDKYAVGQLLMDHPDLTPSEAKRMLRPLATFVRPLRQDSLTSYEHKVLKGIRSPRSLKTQVGKALKRLAAQHGMNLRTVYRHYATFIKKRGLARERGSVQLFARSLRRRCDSEKAGPTEGQGHDSLSRS
ncbi:MAG: hypothetical protein ACHQ7N_19905, partial [Candidatus Methylomirabilales bacterium]